MAHFPKEIEGDLLAWGVDILDWYRGDLSTRRVLVLIDKLRGTETSELAKALVEDWPLQAQIATGVLNEIRMLRSDLSQIPFNPVLTPGAERERDNRRTVIRSAHDDVIEALHVGEDQVT